MNVLFYLLSVVSVLATIGVILNVCPMYALLCLILSFLSISSIFFILSAYVAGVLEIIIYTGAIVVLFIFVIMILNIDFCMVRNSDLIVQYDIRKFFLLFMFLILCLYVIWNEQYNCVDDVYYFIKNSPKEITFKSVGLSLFGHYILVVEMASILLLGSLIVSIHIGRSSSCNIINIKKQ